MTEGDGQPVALRQLVEQARPEAVLLASLGETDRTVAGQGVFRGRLECVDGRPRAPVIAGEVEADPCQPRPQVASARSSSVDSV